MNKPLFEVKGDGFDLVPLQEQHLPLTMAWRNADNVRVWFKTPDVLSPEQHLNWYAAYATRQYDHVFLIRNHASGAFAGQLAIYRVDLIRKEAEMGRLIIAPGFEGKGLMKKACICLIAHTKMTWGLKRIYLEVLSSNERAVHLYEKLGFDTVRHDGQLQLMALELGPA